MSCGAVLGTPIRGIAVLLLVSTLLRGLVTSATVFGLFVLRRGLLSPWLFCPFALCPWAERRRSPVSFSLPFRAKRDRFFRNIFDK